MLQNSFLSLDKQIHQVHTHDEQLDREVALKILAAEFTQLPNFEAYFRKLKVTLSALEKHFAGIEAAHWRRPEGGLYVWLTLPEHLDASEGGPLWQAAIEAGVL